MPDEIARSIARLDPSPTITEKLLVAGAAAFTIIAWSAAFIAIDICLDEIPARSIASTRIATGFIAFAALVILTSGKRDLQMIAKGDYTKILFMALLMFPLYHFALIYGQQKVQPGLASLLINFGPAVAAVLGSFFLNERLSSAGWLGLIIAIAGVGMIVTTNTQTIVINGHAMLIVFAAICPPASVVIQRSLNARYSGTTLTLASLLVSTLAISPLLPEASMDVIRSSPRTVFALLFLGVVPTALAFFSWTYVVRWLPAAKATSLIFFMIPVTYAGSYLILAEVPRWEGLLGGAMMLIGVLTVHCSRMIGRPGKRKIA